MKNWSRVLRYFVPELPRVWLALAMMALSIAANLLKPWPVALIIDSIVAGRPIPEWVPEMLRTAAIPTLLAVAAAAVFILHSAHGVFAAGQNFLSIQAGLHGLARLRQELFGVLQRLSLAFFHRQNQGDLIYRATWDTYSIQTVFQQGLFKFFNSFATILLMVIVMWRVNATLTLMTLAVFPPLLLTMYSFGRKMNRRSLEAHQADSKVTTLVQQSIATLPLVQSFTRETEEGAIFGHAARRSLVARVAQHRIEILYWLVIALLFGLATAGLTWWGAQEILKQQLTVGELVIFLTYLGQLYDPLNQLSHVGATVADANAGVERIFEIMDGRIEAPESATPSAFPEQKAGGISVAFANVTFGYEPQKPVLSNLSFKIEAGETVGLIGPSGSGKTTLLNLLPRFYEPNSGEIHVQNIRLRDLGLKELRERVGYVFQEPFLLPGTVAENIGFGRANAAREEIEAAARAANAHEFIVRLPGGYDTLVGEGAARLSVGEKQRISIARAFLKDAPILLLDEPTSSLDAETEAQIVESLKRLTKNRTTLLAAHRLATLKQVNRIMVLERGRLVEFGRPEELLRTNGYYSRLATLA